MSRFRKFAHSLISGYVLLAGNVIYTLGSVPLALKFLSKPEFGLWGVTTMVAGYIALVDLGMSASMARILIDHKDECQKGVYGSLIKTGSLVSLVQGLIIFVLGAVLAAVAGPLLRVPNNLEKEFVWLMTGQCAVVAFSFATRIFSHVLTAHQRYDISNYAQVILFAVNFTIMWVLFERGFGVFSILWAQAVGATAATLVNALGCWRLRLFPRRGSWGQVSWKQFEELFKFGKDIFLFALGSQLINTSQALLLTRFLGLEAAAVWSVSTRTYTMLLQMIYRIFDYSSSALAEMMVRGEKELLEMRFRQIVAVSTSLSVVAGMLFALCNGPFVEVWTAAKIGWPPRNNLLLAFWLVVCVSVHAHVGLVGQTKRFEFLRYIFFIEGLSFVGLTVLLHKLGGMTGMLVVSIACSLAFSFPYGLGRTRNYFGLAWRELAEWHRAPFHLTILLLPIVALAAWLTSAWVPLRQLVFRMALIGIPALWLFLRYGLGTPVQIELARRLPAWMRPFLLRVCCFPPIT